MAEIRTMQIRVVCCGKDCCFATVNVARTTCTMYATRTHSLLVLCAHTSRCARGVLGEALSCTPSQLTVDVCAECTPPSQVGAARRACLQPSSTRCLHRADSCACSLPRVPPDHVSSMPRVLDWSDAVRVDVSSSWAAGLVSSTLATQTAAPPPPSHATTQTSSAASASVAVCWC